MSAVLVAERGVLCNAFYEDFLHEQLCDECLVCLKCVPPVHCLSGSHPRYPSLLPATKDVPTPSVQATAGRERVAESLERETVRATPNGCPSLGPTSTAPSTSNNSGAPPVAGRQALGTPPHVATTTTAVPPAAASASSVVAVKSATFFIVPGTDLTTAGGIGGAVNRLVTFIEFASSGESAVPSIVSIGGEIENGKQQVAVIQLFNAIPAYIRGRDDYDVKETMIEIGAPESNVIGNLTKLLNVLLKIVSSPSEPSYSTASTALAKTLVTVQKLMRYRDDDSETSCDENIAAFGDARLCEVLVKILKKYNLKSQPEAAAISLVLSECCKTIRNVATVTNGRRIFEKVPGSVTMLVDVLKTHGLTDATVAQACCDAIANATAGFASSAVVKYGAVPVLVDILKTHGCTNAAVAEACCRAIHRGYDFDLSLKKRWAFSTTDLVTVLVDVIKAHGKTNTTQSQRTLYCCFHVIQWLCFLNLSNRAKFAKLKTIQVIDSKVISVRNQYRALDALGKRGFRTRVWGMDVIMTGEDVVFTILGLSVALLLTVFFLIFIGVLKHTAKPPQTCPPCPLLSPFSPPTCASAVTA